MKSTLNIRFYKVLFLTCLLAGLTSVYSQDRGALSHTQKNTIVQKTDLDWGALNPLRGDASPRAATLWGDRTATGPSGFLVQFKDGFSSPPHIHNVTYRGVVISGLIHNDDPQAENQWMGQGSYWTQPAGDNHITSAKGGKSLAYIEIEDGPYLVKPTKEAFDNGEQSVNVDVSNLVWLDSSDMTWIDQPGNVPVAKRAAIAVLWGSTRDGDLRGSLIKLPAGFKGEIATKGSSFHAVVIQGSLSYKEQAGTGAKGLEPTSYFGSKGQMLHKVSNKGSGDVIIYVRTNENYEIR